MFELNLAGYYWYWILNDMLEWNVGLPKVKSKVFLLINCAPRIFRRTRMLNKPPRGSSGGIIPKNILYFKVSIRPILALWINSPCTQHTSKITEKLTLFSRLPVRGIVPFKLFAFNFTLYFLLFFLYSGTLSTWPPMGHKYLAVLMW